MTPTDSAARLWHAYQQAGGDGGPADYSVWYFADNEADANGLVELVLAGAKRATASALWAHETDGKPVPRPGDLSIVTDWGGTAKCIIRTTAVNVVPYDEVTDAFAATEGEGDLSLSYWREVHWPYFAREMRRIGRELNPTLPVVCHEFEVVYP